jgi:hypothetical protein
VTVNGHPIGTWTPLFNEPEDFQARFPEAIPIETPRVATEPNTLKESPQDIAQRARRERQKRIDAVLRASNKK